MKINLFIWLILVSSFVIAQDSDNYAKKLQGKWKAETMTFMGTIMDPGTSTILFYSKDSVKRDLAINTEYGTYSLKGDTLITEYSKLTLSDKYLKVEEKIIKLTENTLKLATTVGPETIRGYMRVSSD